MRRHTHDDFENEDDDDGRTHKHPFFRPFSNRDIHKHTGSDLANGFLLPPLM